MQRAYQITKQDNVATALDALQKGPFELLGNTCSSQHIAIEPIQVGHKIALCDISKGSPIIKYNIVIGEATTNIAQGTWVHLHCMKSLYDERSSHLDLHTGKPQDVLYE